MILACPGVMLQPHPPFRDQDLKRKADHVGSEQTSQEEIDKERSILVVGII